MARKNERNKLSGFLSRLRQDQAGNVIAIVGASIIPMIAIIGGSVDISRGYMVKVRLQQACDAGALGGRQAVGEGVFDAAAATRAQAMFKANFPTNYQGAKETTFSPSSPDGGVTVIGTAKTKMPTVMMGLFKDDETISGLKTQHIELTANCNARMEVSNSDIMMVLDTTGSMACPNNFDKAQCDAWWVTNGNNPIAARDAIAGANSRMSAMRTATINFATILNAAANGTVPTAPNKPRIRFGFVPYTMAVNTGKLLLAANQNFIVGGNANENWNYQSRRAVYKADKIDVTEETVVFPNNSTTGTFFTSSVVRDVNCDNFSGNYSYGGYGSNDGTNWFERANITPAYYGYTSSGQNVTKVGDPGATYTFAKKEWGPATPFYNVTYNRKSCTRYVTRLQKNFDTYDKNAPNAVFDRWEYSNRTLPVSDYVRSANTANPAISNEFKTGLPPTYRWGGCILERATTSAGTFNYNGSTQRITPNSAQDLDIDTPPTADDASSRWKPYWPEASYSRTSTSLGSATQTSCPQEAQLFSVMNNTAFATYVNGLSSDGATFHDIGTLWGARLSSPTGIFAANVLQPPANNGFVARHMIIMTDGDQSGYDPTRTTMYTSYGVEPLDSTIAGGDLTQGLPRHISRFRAICEAVKAKGIRVWFIAFGTTLNADMTACASANSSFASSNATQLNDTFVQIAQSIAELRLTR
jgi:Flp pilus assembly protein TadG